MKAALNTLTTGKDNLLMSTVVASCLAMAVLGAVISKSEAGSALNAAVTPAAMQPTAIYQEPAIIVSAPRLSRAI